MVCGVLVVAKDSEVLIESHISFWNSCHLHGYICMYSVYVDTPTERQTDRQTDRHYSTHQKHFSVIIFYSAYSLCMVQ